MHTKTAEPVAYIARAFIQKDFNGLFKPEMAMQIRSPPLSPSQLISSRLQSAIMTCLLLSIDFEFQKILQLCIPVARSPAVPFLIGSW
jgi:hypothetical protein